MTGPLELDPSGDPARHSISRPTTALRGAAPLLALLALAVLVGLAGWLGYRYSYDTALTRQPSAGRCSCAFTRRRWKASSRTTTTSPDC